MKCRRIRDTIPLTPYVVDGIAARTMTCALFKRWVTATFHIDPELPMSDPRNLGQGDPPPRAPRHDRRGGPEAPQWHRGAGGEPRKSKRIPAF
jgi:hypothetical protein